MALVGVGESGGSPMRRLWTALAVLVLTLGLVHAAWADDGPVEEGSDVYGTGGAVKAMQSTTVRMAAETVQAICYGRFAEYRIDFRFVNEVATQTVNLGFPFATTYYRLDTYHAPAGFSAWQDGRPLAVALRHGWDDELPTDFYVHRAVFGPGDTTITVSYLITSEDYDQADPDAYIPPAHYSAEDADENWYDYTLHTGSYWKGDIGTAVLRWTMSPDFIGWGTDQFIDDTWRADVENNQRSLYDRILSRYTTPTPDTYQWVLHDFNPGATAEDDEAPSSDYDIGFPFLAPPRTGVDDPGNAYANPIAHASSSLRLGTHSYPAENLVDGDPSTAWAEGVAGSGIGQSVRVTFPAAHLVQEIRVLPGYAKRSELFAKYNRPKRLRFDFSDGTSDVITLADRPALQRFKVPATIAKWARMTVLDVDRGTTRDETYVSEVEFGSIAAPNFADPGILLAQAADEPSADRPDSTTPSPTAARAATAPVPTAQPASDPRPSSRALAGALVTLAAFAVATLLVRRAAP